MVYTAAGLWADTTEVTIEAYESVMHLTPSYTHRGICPQCPVENITAEEAMLYANALTKLELNAEDTVYAYTAIEWETPMAGTTMAATKTKEAVGLTGLTMRAGAKGYRLPTESEWSALAKGGTSDEVYWTSLYSIFADAATNAGLYAWYSANASGLPQSVAQKLPNAFGLYDILGNVEEYTTSVAYNDWVSKGVAADATLGALFLTMAVQVQWLTGARLVRDP